MADLGIEFEPVKSSGDGKSGFAKKPEDKDRYQERNNGPHHMVGKPVPQTGPRPAVTNKNPVKNEAKSGIMSSIKKILHAEPIHSGRPNPLQVKRVDPVRPPVVPEQRTNPLHVQVQRHPVKTAQPGGENTALKEALNKITTPAVAPTPTPTPTPTPAPKPVVEPLSLDALKQKNKEILNSNSKDRAATAEDMDKLKNLIIERTEVKPTPVPTPPPQPTPVPPQTPEKTGTIPPLTTGNVKEVPEDVLKKLLE